MKVRFFLTSNTFQEAAKSTDIITGFPAGHSHTFFSISFPNILPKSKGI